VKIVNALTFSPLQRGVPLTVPSGGRWLPF
jgi:hypothetical protein